MKAKKGKTTPESRSSDAIENGNAEEFHHGENSSESNPSEIIANFVAHRSKGVTGAVESAIIVTDGMVRFKGNAEQLKEFSEGLHNAKVLAQKEVANIIGGRSSATISKFKKIADYRSWLLNEKILPFLSTGYSTLYELANLAEELAKGQQGVDQLFSILSESDGEATRSWTSAKREELRSSTGASEVYGEQHDDVVDVDQHEVPPLQADQADDTTKNSHKEEPIRRQTVKALLLTVTDDDVMRFDEALADNAPIACVKISNDIDAEAVLLISGKADTLLSMSTIIGSLGFQRCVRIGLLSEPEGADITSCEAMAVYLRGNVPLPNGATNWNTNVDPAKLADQILEGISGRRVHLFAAAAADGWETLVGEAAWNR